MQFCRPSLIREKTSATISTPVKISPLQRTEPRGCTLESLSSSFLAAGGIVKTRSGLARKRLMCNAGVIDAGYRGEIIVLMENLGEVPYCIRKGDKIAQLLEHPFLATAVVEGELSDAVRGAKGFGSTGE